jgi:multiple inositol-polyphosphate phosphatase/2,3-bisphosphoglycerate 3-phosphatase
MPPQGRNWKGSVVAPFAGNNMLVLYQCPGKTSDGSTSGSQKNSYFIQVLHNELPVSMPVRVIAFMYFDLLIYLFFDVS